MLLPDGTSLDNMEMVHNGAVNYFEQFLGINDAVQGADLENFIQPSISNVIISQLREEPTEEEVYAVLKSISVDSSPGPDGFGSSFYLTCWKIIKDDVMAAVKEFFKGDALPRFYCSSFIVLIPKVKNPQSFDKFRPISLCNVIYKAFSRIIVNKSSMVIRDLISPAQGAFVRGRSIFENVTLTQEMTKMLHRKVRGGNVILKIDMSKAYDRFEWKFVDQTLHAFGFPDFFYKLIQNCITTPWFSIMMHGTYRGFFKSKRGLRQGDPLSLYLFILMEEILSRMINLEMLEKHILPFSHPGGAPAISHFLYADDVVIFANASKRSIRGLMKVLKKYESWTGQRVNQEKSAIFFSEQLSLRRKNEILDETGFVEGKFPFTYLGVPIVDGKLRVSQFDPLIQKISKKVEGWKSRLLSQGGRLVLLRHVLSSMPLHLLSFLNTPKIVFKKIQVPIFAKFSEGEHSQIRLKELVINNAWDVKKLQRLLGLNKAEEVIEKVGTLRTSEDVLLWLPEKNGFFNTKSAMDVVRFRLPKFEWAKWVWHKCLPKKIVVCMWKAAFDCLSLDEKVRSVGVPIVSACNCCSIRGNEDLDHIFNKGDFASNLWRKVSAEVGVTFLSQPSWKERVQLWFNRAGRPSQLGTLMGLIPCLVIWRLWRRRCVARVEGKLESISDVWLSIKH
ncbi:hypothetical protein Dsin_028422 [Dipteronia sinensis]|uniref:Reverse transcriptase domain-containing protein n=1 Tax=Dipteronia sinensis TaxID=43782 RepID=A0AAE0DUI3_9ROSI|nr:hypothetical protein Dsin_028422 [Dipteronia sinensis]